MPRQFLQKQNIGRGKKEEKREERRCLTDQFVLLQVESLQFAAPFGQGHHAFVGDAVALTQVDVLQLTTLLPQLQAKKSRKYNRSKK